MVGRLLAWQKTSFVGTAPYYLGAVRFNQGLVVGQVFYAGLLAYQVALCSIQAPHWVCWRMHNYDSTLLKCHFYTGYRARRRRYQALSVW